MRAVEEAISASIELRRRVRRDRPGSPAVSKLDAVIVALYAERDRMRAEGSG